MQPDRVAGSVPLAGSPVTGAALDRVLVVEDDAELGMLFRDWIQEFYGDDTAVHVTATATDTETTLGSLPGLDAALIDRKLPDGTGDDLVQVVRSQFGAFAVLVTGAPPDGELAEIPADDYLLKPVDEETLLERLSLLEKLEATGTLREYAEARKASLLEYHLEEPQQNPLVRRFADGTSYDHLEIADVGDRQVVYERYTGDTDEGDRGASVSVVGSLDPDLGALLSDGAVTPVGELVATEDGRAWVDAGGEPGTDTGSDAIELYEFTCEAPERYVEDGTGISGWELGDILESAYG